MEKTLGIFHILLHFGSNSDKSPVISFTQNGNHKEEDKVDGIVSPKMRYCIWELPFVFAFYFL